MEITLTAETGRDCGSRPSGRLRRQGRIPGVVYGLGREPVAMSVPWSDLRQVLVSESGRNALVTLEVDGERDLAIIKDLQRDPVRRDVIHVDFIRVDPDARIEVEVPLVLTGEPVELTRDGGIVEHQLTRLLVSARVTAIPSELTVDITDLTAAEPVKVGAVALPDGVTTEVDLDEPVATGFIPRAMAEEEEEEVEGPEGEEAATAPEDAESDAGEASES